MRDGLATAKASETQEKQSLDGHDRGSLKRVNTNTASMRGLRDGSLCAVTDRRCDTLLAFQMKVARRP